MERSIFKEEHVIFRDSFRKFLEREIKPHLERWEEEGIVPREAWKKMGANGYLCPWLEECYGGMGAGFEYSVVIIEELARAGCSGLLAGLHSDIIVPYIHSYGTEEQKARWLPGCASGDVITAVAMTEPDTGSDLAAIRTAAVREGDHYVLNGQKTFISLGLLNDLVIVAAKTDPRAVPPTKGVSLICVEAGTPGYHKGRKLAKMGLHSQDTAELSFEDCRVPAANLLGKEGHGFYYLMQKLQQERLVCSIMAQAMAEAMLEMTVDYCKRRTVFGQPVSSFQHNTFKIVEMATEIELGRTFTDALIADHIAGREIVKRVSMAKAWVCEMANRVAYHCVQLHGGYGYMEEYPICRFARDIRVFPIFAGTTEVMKVIVGRLMGL
ncbi:MAG TPA: acyl-CoA dehydrogenase family protein [Syntrophales bacterium]|nr:acyl-CoA dehydrogenase family protein [Syntrophales bacterium]HOM06637.1 acyl-CoA dehydrogenase family protein [Syntrophales bacterium]HON99787.1 acyl-CoA dehydrogenase family protein [Syntrophales bacterium]HPC01141.1 acyl-CoA dehydrogenase family protein [Syntrophales bacterium]HPQ06298.1 acyl-CoA dehydrogenase family protein [Syntrophales bacterium]